MDLPGWKSPWVSTTPRKHYEFSKMLVLTRVSTPCATCRCLALGSRRRDRAENGGDTFASAILFSSLVRRTR